MTDLEKVKKGLDLCLTGEPSTCKDCPYDAECKEARGIGPSPLRRDALELLKEQPKQKFFVDSDGKMTPLPIQKHGHWKNDKYGNILCSVCGGLAVKTMTGCLADRHLASYLSDYCPQCGAKMDGEVEQE